MNVLRVNRKNFYAGLCWPMGSAILLLFVLSGCVRGPSSYFRTSSAAVDQKVRLAIIPFNNLSSQRDADMKMTYTLITHLLNSHFFDVVEIGETKKAIADAKVRKDEELSLEQIKQIGEQVGAEVLLLGAVDEYKIDAGTLMGEKVFVPEVSVSMRLLAVNDGTILWSAIHHRRGDDRVTVFGMGRIDSISELTDVIIRDTVFSLVVAIRNQTDAIAVMRNGHEESGISKNGEALEEAQGQTETFERELENVRKENETLKSEIKRLQESEMEVAPTQTNLPASSSNANTNTPVEGESQAQEKRVESSVQSDVQFIRENVLSSNAPAEFEITSSESPKAAPGPEEEKEQIRQVYKQTYEVIKAGY